MYYVKIIKGENRVVYLFLANGFEETEGIAPFSILKRARIEIKTVGVGSDIIKGSNGLTIKTDITDENISFENLKGIVLPGGMPGTTNLENSQNVIKCIDYCAENKLMIGAICAAPSILGKKGLLSGKEACCYPGFERYLEGAKILDKSVTICDNIITANGPGSAMKFAFELVGYLRSQNAVKVLKYSMKYE